MTNSALNDITLSGGSPTVTGTTFTDGYPIRLTDPDSLTDGFSGNTYSHADPWILFYGTLDGTRTLGPVDGLGNYRLGSHLTVAAGATLTLGSGVTLVNDSHYIINVSGRLEGTDATLGLQYSYGSDRRLSGE